jgi:hypothetical protein
MNAWRDVNGFLAKSAINLLTKFSLWTTFTLLTKFKSNWKLLLLCSLISFSFFFFYFFFFRITWALIFEYFTLVISLYIYTVNSNQGFNKFVFGMRNYRFWLREEIENRARNPIFHKLIMKEPSSLVDLSIEHYIGHTT